MKFHQAVLSNGLKIVGEVIPGAVSTAIGFFVKTGARDEDINLAGVSHFLEHMMFKGTEKRSALDISYQMGAIGAQANAFTSEESTVYYMAVLNEYFEQAFELLSDMMRSSIDPHEFSVEKKVILEEIALYQDRPTYVLLENAMSTFFGNHPAGNSVLGTNDSISALTRDQMFNYFSNRYAPNNIVLSVCGGFEFNELVALAEKYCGSWKNVSVTRDNPVLIKNSVKKILTRPNLTRAHAMLLAPGPDMRHKLTYAAEVLVTILGDSSGSRLYWELVDKGLADGASVESEQMDGVGIFYSYVSTNPDKLDQVVEIVKKIVTSPLDFSTGDLERAITKTATRMVIQGESTMRRMMAIGFDSLYLEEYISLEDELKSIKSVSLKDIRDLIEEFPLDPTHEMLLIPE